MKYLKRDLNFFYGGESRGVLKATFLAKKVKIKKEKSTKIEIFLEKKLR